MHGASNPAAHPPGRSRHPGRVVNGIVAAVLRSPAHRLLSGSLLLLTFPRWRGGEGTIPVMYVRSGDGLLLAASDPEHKRWWRNLRSPKAVRVRLRGRSLGATAVVCSDRAEIEWAIEIYLGRFPRAARALGVELDAGGRADPASVSRAAESAVMIRVDLPM